MRFVCQEHNRRANRISLETRDRQFALLSSCSKRHWDRRLPSLAGSRLPLPKRFCRGLVEVRISRGRDDPYVRNVSLRIERQSKTSCPRLPGQRLAWRKRRRRRKEQSRLWRRLRCRACLGHLCPARLSIGLNSRQDRVQLSDRARNGFFSRRRDDANNIAILIYHRRPNGTRGRCPRNFQSIRRM